MSILFSEFRTVWMWIVFPTFRRYMLPTTSRPCLSVHNDLNVTVSRLP
jgi:hypothetical protein